MQYEVIPFLDIPGREKVIEEIVRKTCSFDTAFSDYQATCADNCVSNSALADFCELCKVRAAVVAVALTKGLTWEVWGDEGVVGIIRLSDIRPGEDALGHYIFFDRKLNGKTEVVQAIINWAFEEHEGWTPLHRLTVQVPDFAFALARHATKKLGFGGPFDFEMKGRTIPVEGVKREGIMWRGTRRDLLTLGLVNPSVQPANLRLDGA
jgi:RimJ/RimL family protein N-acetyltransferase